MDTIPRLGLTAMEVVADLVSGGSGEERFQTGCFAFDFFAYGCSLLHRVFFAHGIGAGDLRELIGLYQPQRLLIRTWCLTSECRYEEGKEKQEIRKID